MNAIEAIRKYDRIFLSTYPGFRFCAKLEGGVLYWYPIIEVGIFSKLPVALHDIYRDDWVGYEQSDNIRPCEELYDTCTVSPKQKDNKQHKFSYILYDTVNISSEYRQRNYDINFFSIVKGQSEAIVNIDDTANYRCKTMMDTNMCSPKTVDCDFVFSGISILAKNINLLQYNLLQENCMIEVCVNNHAFCFPLSFIPFAITKDTEQNVKFLPVGDTMITRKDIFYPKIKISNPDNVGFLKERHVSIAVRLHGTTTYRCD